MRTSRPPKSNSSQAHLPSDHQGFVLLLTLMLGIFLSALVAWTYQSETQSNAHSKILLNRLKIYPEARLLFCWVWIPLETWPGRPLRQLR